MTADYILTTEEALMLVLNEVDYTRGNCSVTDMVGAVLPKEVIDRARKALAHQQRVSAGGAGER
jgi:hypothetical protein